MANEHTTCLACGSDAVSEFLELRGVPVDCSVFQRSPEDARRMQRADIHLAHCATCDHIFNAAFRPGVVAYEEGYDNSLSHSARFRRYARELAEALVRRFQLYGKRVTEIGSGNGEFLRELCRLGENLGTGYDPSYVPSDDTAGPGGVEYVRELFGEGHAGRPADFVCCRHVLEHIDQPSAFVGLVRRSGADVYFEVPDVRFTLRDGGIWDIIYPHVSYFSPRPLTRLFRDAGFEVMSVTGAFEGQFLGIHASAKGSAGEATAGDEPDGEIAGNVVTFGQLYRDTAAFWKSELSARAGQGQRIVLWGGGAKCVSFLHAIEGAGNIESVVDLNPNKQGLYVPGAGARVVGPDALRELRPDVVIVANPIYRAEIERMLNQRDVRPREVLCLNVAQALAA